jgi:PIN domain nuclease of toxin-antitoxin system
MGVTYLLDTHALIWLTGDGTHRSPHVEEAVLSPDATTLVSAASAFEIATKVRLGKLEEARALHERWPDRIADFGARELPITAEHARLAGSLPWDHRDPFDRLLVAQASCDNLVLVTADRAVLTAPGVRLLAW